MGRNSKSKVTVQSDTCACGEKCIDKDWTVCRLCRDKNIREWISNPIQELVFEPAVEVDSDNVAYSGGSVLNWLDNVKPRWMENL